MKIKGKYEKISPLAPLYTVLALLVVTIPFRVYQHLNIVAADTGFYKRIDWSVYLMYAVATVAVVIPYILTYLAKNIPASKSPFRKNRFLAVTSIIFAIGIIVDVVSAFSQFILNIKSFSAIGASAFGPLNPQQIPLLIEAVAGVVASIYMLIFGISYIDGRTTYSQYKFMALTPLFWAMSRLVVRFVKKIAYINVSDLMLELFGIAFLMMFLLSFARISSGLANEKAMRNAFASGSATLFFLATANVSRLLVIITGNGNKLPYEYPFALCDLGVALFIVAYIINAVRYANENDSEELNSSDSVKAESNMDTDDNFLSE